MAGVEDRRNVVSFTSDGATVSARFGVEVWRDGRAEVRVAVDGTVTQVVIDPDEQLPDVNREDNSWTVGGAGGS